MVTEFKVSEIDAEKAKENSNDGSKNKESEDASKSENSEESKPKYNNETIQYAINRKLNTIDKTRRNRINLSNRLMRYSRAWQFIFFIINIEAVIFVLLALTNSVKDIKFWIVNIPFDLLSGIFTIYVILLQYYINVLNYNERALRAHYHQLELRDLALKLKVLLIRDNTEDHSDENYMKEQELIDEYETIISKYQMALKNNENHRGIDNRITMHGSELKKHLKKGLPLADFKQQHPEPKDKTSDILLIYANGFLTIVMLIIILTVVLF